MPARPRPHATSGPDGGDAPSIAAAQAQVTSKARDGHLGAGGRADAGRSGPASGPAATTPLRPPNALRHNLNSIKLNSRSKDKNTIVLPGTDVAGEKLQELTRATPLELAQAVCRVARTRALLDEGSPAPDYWFLVAADGSFGRVMTDPDNDDLTILYALEPIPGEPGLEVVPPPDWAKTW